MSIEAVKGWLLERKPEAGDLDPDFDLIDSRVVDSLMFLELVYFLEELVGRELQASAETVHHFRTLRAIEENILNGRS